jgi:FkbM family methyltransferase
MIGASGLPTLKTRFFYKNTLQRNMDFNASSCLRKNKNASYSKPNEDYLICDPSTGFFMVADGVTRDFQGSLYPDPSPASEVSRLFCQSIFYSWVTSTKDDFNKILGTALWGANKMLKQFNEIYFLGKDEYEAGTVALAANISGKMLRLCYIGDCGCLVVRGDKKIWLTNPQTLLVTKYRQSLSRWQIRKEIQNNSEHPMGFGVFNGDERVESFIEYIEYEVQAEDVVWLYSDGCEPALKSLDSKQIANMSPEKLIVAAEHLECEEHLRSDDKAAIRIALGAEAIKNVSKDFIYASTDHSIISAFEAESDVIVNFIRNEKLHQYFDVGCWYGLLLNKVLKKHPDVKIVGVDGVRRFIDIAEANCCEPGRVVFVHRALTPQSRMGASYRVNADDSSKSGLDTTGDIAEDAPTISVKDWTLLAEVKDRLNSCYLKLDLEGIDFEIIEELLALSIRPMVIHFEVLKRTRHRLPQLLALLQENGYAVPNHLPDNHAFHSVICSYRQAVVLGFKPFNLYWHE